MLVPLFICFFIFVREPIKGVYTLAACISVWLEWRVGIRIGLIDFAVVGCFIGLALQPKIQIKENTFVKFLVISLCIVCIISSIAHPGLQLKDLFRRLWDIFKSIYIPLLFFIFYKIINNKKQLKNVIFLIIASSTISSIFGIIQAITQKPITVSIGTYGQYIRDGGTITYGEILRAFGTLTDANNFGGFLIFPLSLTIAILITNKNIVHKRKLWISAALQIISLLLSLSRGSLLGFVLSLFLIFLFSGVFKSFKTWIILILFAVVVFGGEAAGLHIIPNRIKNRTASIENGTKDDAMTPRFARWDYFLKKSLKRPLTGWGTIGDQETSEYFEGIAVSPHNTYLFIAVKRGYIAVAIVSLIVILTIIKAISNLRTIGDPLIKALNIGITSSFIGLFTLSAIFDPYLQENQVDIMFWLFVALCMKSKYLVQKEEPEQLLVENRQSDFA